MSRLRIRTWGEYDHRGKNGFTLVELLVVVVILGILAAIAIPTMLGQRSKAQDAAAISALRSTVDSAESIKDSIRGDWSLFTQSDCLGSAQIDICAAMRIAEPAYNFTQWGQLSTAPTDIRVFFGGTTYLIFQNRSKSGRHYCEFLSSDTPALKLGSSMLGGWETAPPGCLTNAANNAGW